MLAPGYVAALFRVDPKTVWRWGTSGQLSYVIEPGRGERRYRTSEVAALLAAADSRTEAA